LAARSLINKRLREVARAWPALARRLGDGFVERFGDFARANPPPAGGGPLEDGRAFAKTLPAHELDDASRLELLWANLYHSRVGARVAWLPDEGRLVLGARLPWLGARVASLRLRRAIRAAHGASPRAE
jgi:hypothetical protein